MNDDQDTMEVLRFLIKTDFAHDMFFWTDKNGKVCIGPNLNDFFAWACADSEPIEVEDIPAFQSAIDDCKAAGHEWYAPELWAARKRKMMPQERVFENLAETLKPLFKGAAKDVEPCKPPKP